MWFVFDNCLVLPEYLVEFDYITNFECKPVSMIVSHLTREYERPLNQQRIQ